MDIDTNGCVCLCMYLCIFIIEYRLDNSSTGIIRPKCNQYMYVCVACMYVCIMYLYISKLIVSKCKTHTFDLSDKLMYTVYMHGSNTREQ